LSSGDQRPTPMEVPTTTPPEEESPDEDVVGSRLAAPAARAPAEAGSRDRPVAVAELPADEELLLLKLAVLRTYTATD
jgi:hypothetical protein